MKKIGLLIGLVVALILLVLPAPRIVQTPPASLTDADVVQPDELSAWMLSGEQGYLLIDLRPEAAYLEDAIKTALSVPAASLDDALIKSLPAHRRLVVYANDTEEAIAAWQAVKRHRTAVYVLAGGLSAWRDTVLYPTKPADDAPEAAWAAYQERLAVANYYLGKTEEAPVAQERVVRPLLRAQTAGAGDEGC
jgi:rhodanese-related sulfurtransferase